MNSAFNIEQTIAGLKESLRKWLQCWRNRNCVIALDLQQNCWSALELRKRGKKVEVLYCHLGEWQEHSLPLPDRAIREIANSSMRYKRVYVRLSSSLFRVIHRTLPPGTEDVEAYVEKTVHENLPPGLPRANCRIGCRFFWGEQEAAVLIWIARADILQRWQQAFEAENMWLAGATGTFDDCLISMAAAETEYYTTRLMFVKPVASGLLCMISEHGILKRYQCYPDERSMVSDLKTTHRSVPDRIVVAPDADLELCESLSLIAPVGSITGFKAKDKKTPVPLELSGLALQAFLPGFEMDYPEDDELQIQNREQQQMLRTVHLGIMSVLAVFLLWVLLFGVRLYVDRELDAVMEGKRHLEQRIEQIERLKELRSSLEAEFEVRRDITGQRSKAAVMLDKIASSMPEKTWLRRIMFGQSDGEKKADPAEVGQIIVEGLALEESGATQLLAALEERNEFGAPQLELIRLLPADLVFKRTKLRKVPLVEFRLRTTWKSHAR